MKPKHITTTVTLSREHLSILDGIANESDRTRSYIVRRAILDYIEKYKLEHDGVLPSAPSGVKIIRYLSPRRKVAREMKQAGKSYAAIGREMGISRQRVQQLVGEPRKANGETLHRSGGVCEECGKKSKKLDSHHSDYSGGPDKVLCPSCHKKADGKLGLVRH